jgi:Trk K+ transport system NAD-binding subunit
VGNPLLLWWTRLVAGDDEPDRSVPAGSGAPPTRGPWGGTAPTPALDHSRVTALAELEDRPGSAGILLVLRRMRAPLIVLILIFAVSVLGLSLLPGQDGAGRPYRMSLFESFYFMSYTATTIGFGEIPYPLTTEQRMWVTFVTFLSVVGWAYAIGSVLALVQDRSFRRALARRRATRKVRRMAEPFLIVVGYGDAAKRIARSLDHMGRRFVVCDRDEGRVSRLDLDSYRADTPAVLGNARDTEVLVAAGLTHHRCEGVLALSNDDETNLDVTMTAALVRPGLPVIARTSSRRVGERMRSFDAYEVVNPLDRFGDHLRILLRSPASYQLMVWLTSAPGTSLPPRHAPLPQGRWVVCGQGRLSRELTADLRAEGLEVTVLDDLTALKDDEATPDQRAREALQRAAAFVAATENDTTNLWLLDAAREANPGLTLVSLHNRHANVPLFEAMDVAFGMVPAEVVAHEVLARLATPSLMRFLPLVPRLGGDWAEGVVDRLVARCGHGTPQLWQLGLAPHDAPALQQRLQAGRLLAGDLLRSPLDRDRQLDAVLLAVLREDGAVLPTPAADEVLHPGDELLVAARAGARRALEATMFDEPTAAYVLDGRFVPVGWLWRKLFGRRA